MSFYSGFYGRYEFLIDENGRVSFPAAFRKQMRPEDEDTVVMTRGIDNSIFVYPKTTWHKYMRKMQRMRIATDEKLRVMRIMLSWASNCIFDPQGRVRIPQHLIKQAGIEREIVISGHYDRVEIWDRNTYFNIHAVPSDEYDGSAKLLFVEMMSDDLDDDFGGDLATTTTTD